MLGELSSPEVPSGASVIIPLGATEQHGPHLPLDTDTRIAVAWANAVALELRSRDNDGSAKSVVVAPALAYGASGEHQGFLGTMSLGNEAFAQAVVELGRSVRSWAGELILLSGHAGNFAALQLARRTLLDEGDIVTALVPVLDGSDAHAGRTETSLMLHLHPDLVELDRAEPGRTEPISELLADLRTHGVVGVSPNGVLGDPSGASAAEGALLLDRLVSYGLDEISKAHRQQMG